MGKLTGSIAYLSGSMDHPNAKGGIEWRERITPILQSMGIGVFNPCNKPILYTKYPENDEMRTMVKDHKENGRWNEVRAYYKQIVSEDLRGIDKCDFLLTYLDIYQHPAGTWNEIYLAAEQRKPILIVCPHGKKEVPNWLFGRIQPELFFSSFEEALEYLKRMDEGLENHLDGRWVFFDYDKIFGRKL